MRNCANVSRRLQKAGRPVGRDLEQSFPGAHEQGIEEWRKLQALRFNHGIVNIEMLYAVYLIRSMEVVDGDPTDCRHVQDLKCGMNCQGAPDTFGNQFGRLYDRCLRGVISKREKCLGESTGNERTL